MKTPQENAPRELADLIVKHLRAHHVTIWDLFCITTTIYENQFRRYDLEITRQAVNSYYVIRTFHSTPDHFGVGIIKANSAHPFIIDTLIEKAQQLAKINTSSRFMLPQPGQSYPSIKLAEQHLLNDPESVLQETTEELQAIVTDLKMVKPTFGKLRFYLSQSVLINSEGLSLDDQKSRIYLEYPLKAESSGKLAEFWGRVNVKNSDQLDLPNRLSHWAKLAADSLRAKVPPPAASITALFPPNVVKDAFSKTVGIHITGRARYEKISRFHKGSSIAGATFSLIDDGIMREGIAVNNWDGEGNPHRTNPVIQNGIFRDFLYDQKYAALENTQSTGNGIRTEDGTILNSFTNLEIPPGTMALDELIESIKFGVVVDEFSWLNPSEVTGSFGSEIRNGYLIEHGEKTTPIKGGNLSGNIFEMLKAIEGVSKERITEENYKFPYFLFSGLRLAV
ncbi:MAG: metallopeptidase TldD-related protein [Candidatus Helarchaeota archaeon]